MATEDAGLELHVDGEDDFNKSLENANDSLAALGETAEEIAGALDSSSAAIDSAGEALAGFSDAAFANAAAVGDVGETADDAEESISGLGDSAEESAGDVDDSSESIGEADDALKDFADSAEDSGSSFDAATEIIVGGLRRIGEVAVDSLLSAGSAFGDFVANSFAGALDAEKVMARLNAQIKAQGSSAAITAEQAGALADQYKHLAGGSDDAIISAEAVLLKFNQISGESFPQTIKVSADLAALMGTDVASAAQQLGFALETGGDGLARIAKQTGAFTDEELKNIKAMQEAGDIAGAQKAILNNLEGAIGGTAEALANTTAGQWAIFQETIGDAGEGIASQFLPPLLSLAQNVLPVVSGAVSDFSESIGGVVSLLATGDFTGGIFGLSEDDPYIVALISLRENALQLYATGQQVFTELPAIVDSARSSVGAAFDELVARAQPVISASENLAASFESSMPQIQGAVEHALTFIQGLWDTVFPSIQSTTDNTLNQIMTLTANILNAIAAYWDENGAAILAQATFFIEATLAVISGTLALISGAVSATLSVINGDWDAAGAALESSTAAFMNAILSIVGTDLESFKKTWSEVFTLAKIIIDTQMAAAATAFGNAIEAIRTAAEPVGTYINGLLDSFKSFYSWLNTHVFSFRIELPELPDWAIPGSPTPFEIGLRGIDRALKQVSIEARDFAYSIEMIPADNPVSPPASASQISTQSVYNSSLSNSLTINAQYPMQSARSVTDDLRMWTMLTGNSPA